MSAYHGTQRNPGMYVTFVEHPSLTAGIAWLRANAVVA